MKNTSWFLPIITISHIMSRISFYLLLVVIVSCSDDPTVGDYTIRDSEDSKMLNDFLESFLAEASIRNVEIDTSDFILEFRDHVSSSGTGVCGVGGWRRNNTPPLVWISKIPRCWGNQDYFWRKELVFHEFGHALLGRQQHDNNTLPNGEKRSIMAQGIHGFFRNETKLKYYLDELFDPSTPVPDWAK